MTKNRIFENYEKKKNTFKGANTPQLSRAELKIDCFAISIGY